MSLSPVPTLAQVAERPELIDELQPRAVAAVILQAQALITRAATRIAVAPVAVGEAQRAEDRVLAVAEAAGVLGISPFTLRHRAKTTYRSLVVMRGRRLGFSARRIQDLIRHRAGIV